MYPGRSCLDFDLFYVKHFAVKACSFGNHTNRIGLDSNIIIDQGISTFKALNDNGIMLFLNKQAPLSGSQEGNPIYNVLL